ncbi:MAG: hypothetical protein ACRCSP_03455 [Rhodoglobus sp.]
MSEHAMAPKRRRFTPVAIATGVLGAVLLSVSMTGTLSAFVASIQNSTNTAATGSLTMEEKTTTGTIVTCLSTDGGTIYTNAATCSTINKFGGSTTMLPGGPAVNTPITIKNTGTVNAATFTLTPGACTQTTAVGAATNLCSKINVVLTSGATTIFSGTAAGLAAGGVITIAGPPAAGATVPFNFAVSLDTTADNTYQNLQASLPLTWTFTS